MKRLKSPATLPVIVILLILGISAAYVIVSRGVLKGKTSQNSSPTPEGIVYPTASDILTPGNTYTLRWNGGGSSSLAIFLTEKDLESQGTSVSIVDRVYNVKNTGSYNYKVPLNLKSGTYKFQIGNLTSKYFNIDSSAITGTNDLVSFCAISSLKPEIALEPAAGNIYGTLTIQNISKEKCRIAADNYPTLSFPSQQVNNVEILHHGKSNSDSYLLDPNQTVYSQVHYPNGPQCSLTKSLPISFSYQFSPTQTLIFKNTGRTDMIMETCQKASETTNVDIWNLSLSPITP